MAMKVGDRVRYGAERGGVITKLLEGGYRCRVQWKTRETVMQLKSLKPDSEDRHMGHDLTEAERAEFEARLDADCKTMWVCDSCGGEFLFGRMTGAWAGYCPHCHSPDIRKQTPQADIVQ